MFHSTRFFFRNEIITAVTFQDRIAVMDDKNGGRNCFNGRCFLFLIDL
jgi:hypothetical protein